MRILKLAVKEKYFNEIKQNWRISVSKKVLGKKAPKRIWRSSYYPRISKKRWKKQNFKI